MAAFDAIFESNTTRVCPGDLFAPSSKFRSRPNLSSATGAAAPPPIAAGTTTEQSGAGEVDASQSGRTSQRATSKRKAEASSAAADAPAATATASKRVKKAAAAPAVEAQGVAGAPQSSQQPQHHSAALSTGVNGKSKGKAVAAGTAIPSASNTVKGSAKAQLGRKEKHSKASKAAAAGDSTLYPSAAAAAPSNAKLAAAAAKAPKAEATAVLPKGRTGKKVKTAKAPKASVEAVLEGDVPVHVEAATAASAAVEAAAPPVRKA